MTSRIKTNMMVAVGALLASAALVPSAFAKTVCNTGTTQNAGNGGWNTGSSCACGSSITGVVQAARYSTGTRLVYAAAYTGTNNNEVWSQVWITNSEGLGGHWEWFNKDVPGGAGVTTEYFEQSPDNFFLSPWKTHAVCAN